MMSLAYIYNLFYSKATCNVFNG